MDIYQGSVSKLDRDYNGHSLSKLEDLVFTQLRENKEFKAHIHVKTE